MKSPFHYHRSPASGPASGTTHSSPSFRLLVLAFLTLFVAAGTITGATRQTYAQAVAPQSDEFNATTFTAPFQVTCAPAAAAPCPDAQGAHTWSLDSYQPGQLQIWTQPGTLGGPGSTPGTARNLFLQPFNSSTDWTAVTRLSFPAGTASGGSSGQLAGILVYQDDQNYLFVARHIDSGTASSLQFVQDAGGQMTSTSLPEVPGAPSTVYLSLKKAGDVYQAFFSYDGTTFAPVPLSAQTTSPEVYTARYATPRLGLFAIGGSSSDAGLVAANFDWFHLALATPPTPTATSTPAPTATPSPAPTATSTPTVVTTSPSSAQPGATFLVGGSGYAPGETVEVRAPFPLYNGNTLTVTRTTAAGASGTLSPVSFPVPQGARQTSVRITATGVSSNRSGSATLVVAYHPAISVTGVVPPGGTVHVTGHGFVAQTPVKVSVTAATSSGATATRTVSVTSDGTGRFQTSLTLPTTTRPGRYQVTAVDSAGSIRASGEVAVALSPTLSLSKASVLPGGTVTVTGAGFTAGIPVTVSATFPLYGGGNRTVTATTTTSRGGAFSAKLTVPAQAASGSVTIVARTSARAIQQHLLVRPLAPAISASPAVLLPGTATVIHGTGYLPGSTIHVSIPVKLLSGASSTLTAVAVTNGQGAFSVKVSVPANVQGGTYTATARGSLSGRSARATLGVTKLAPSIVVAPSALAPGAQTTVTGFGFAAGSTITLSISGRALGTATTDATGHFSVQVTVPQDMPSGTTTLTAVSSSGVRATSSLALSRSIARRFYFASIYTGHQENLDLFNPGSIQARVTITYQLTTGQTRTKTVTIKPHSRYTENVNGDLGPGVSTAAVVAGDVPIVASRVAYRGSGGTVAPGASAPATTWYFANGNTSHNYVEYIAIQNPNGQPAQVTLHILPTHRAAFTEYRTVRPTSRLTIKLNRFVHDAVGVVVTSNTPVVANRTMRIFHGVTSKIGAPAPKPSWYFADGPASAQSHNWIGVTNPSGHAVYLTLHAFNSFGSQVGAVKQWLKPNARVGYLINKIAGSPAVAVSVQASGPVVAEQMTYADRNHDQYTTTFGTAPTATSWAFAAVNTAAGQSDTLSLFNPGQAALPIVIQFMDSNGTVTSRTYVVGPMAHRRIDVASVMPSAQLGLLVTSNQPFAALNRYTFNRGMGGDTSTGIATSK